MASLFLSTSPQLFFPKTPGALGSPQDSPCRRELGLQAEDKDTHNSTLIPQILYDASTSSTWERGVQ